MTKIALIGAGSVEFTRSILADLFTYPELRGSLEVALHDIDPDRLSTAGGVAQRMNDATSAAAKIAVEPQRRGALDGADYVINEIQVGGFDATRMDFEIPRRYGVRQTIADTLGIGGIFRGLRTIPVVVAIGTDMAKLCPDALLLTYANPMAMVTWGVYAGSPLANVVGVCHSVRDTHEHLAELVGLRSEEVTFVTAGLNHQAFVLRFEHEGRDLYPQLLEVLERDPEHLLRVRVEMFRRLGFFPTESSEHSAEYVPWFLPHDDQVERFRIPVDDYIQRSKENLEAYEDVKRAIESEEDLPVDPGSELASEIIHSLEAGVPREVYVNVRNDGKIEGLPDAACIEVPADVDADGLRPKRIGALPPQLLALNRTFLNVVELTVLAALEGRRDLVYQAAMLDPNTAATLPIDRIVALCDELIDAHGDALPEGIRRA